jgi:hypothetical protein
MLTIDRWLKWRPSDEKFSEISRREPPKPPEPSFEGFEGSISEETPNFSGTPGLGASQKNIELGSIPTPNPDAWRADFDRWVSERCIHREGRDDWGGIGGLWVDFCEWVVSCDSVPCTRQTFERLLDDAGFRCSEGMVSGMILRADFEAVGL